jgi:hypothetical protein
VPAHIVADFSVQSRADEVAVREDELARVLTARVPEVRPGVPALPALVLKGVLVAAGLADGVDRVLLHAPVPDADALEVAAGGRRSGTRLSLR